MTRTTSFVLICTSLTLSCLLFSFSVQITAGAIPKGLHVLNLSKNYISVIEGLKDLTKLRILDLSHNRISRIGHGISQLILESSLYDFIVL